MKTTINKAPTVLCSQAPLSINGSRRYEVFHFLDLECLDLEKITQPEVMDTIAHELADLLGKGECMYRVVTLSQYTWAFAAWHPQKPRGIKVYKDNGPAIERVIPCGAVLFVLDCTHQLILISRGSHTCEASEILNCFTPLFKRLRSYKDYHPHWVCSEAITMLSPTLRHPNANSSCVWQHLRLKDIQYLLPGEEVEITRRTWSDDGFNSSFFKGEITLAKIKEFTLVMDTKASKKPIALTIKSDTNVIKTTLNASTFYTITSVLEKLFQSLPITHYKALVR